MAEERTHGSSVAVASAGAPPTVKSIFIYPIKSCKGISVSKAPLSPTGFVWDRHWVVINSKGRGYTQRVEPKLALVQVELPLEAFSFGWEPNNSSYLVVRAPGMAELKVSLAKPDLRSDGVSVWEWSGSALDEGDEAAKWFTDFLGKPSRLVRFNEESETRPTDPHYATGFNVKFPDAFPYLLISEVSTRDVRGLVCGFDENYESIRHENDKQNRLLGLVGWRFTGLVVNASVLAV
ncbi:putative molybdenum cofactor sulfurtransferase [Helianthus annuus]|nr:putative molybdenum cofactor sulfurtransferase [Helianthus annuus]